MVKVRFKNGINGSWTDLSTDPLSTLCGLSTIKRRVESKNKGEAGVIGLDNVSATFYNTPGGTIYNAFNGDLTSVQRYIFEIYGKKSTGVEVKQFEGVADFSSVTRPDFENKISFNIVDKLKALDILTDASTQRGNSFSVANRVDANTTHLYFFSGRGSGGNYPGHDWNAFGNCGDETIIMAFENNGSYWGMPLPPNTNADLIVKKGETIRIPHVDGDKYYFVRDSWIDSIPSSLAASLGYSVAGNWVRLYELQTPSIEIIAPTDSIIYSNNYYNRGENFIDVYSSAPDGNGRYAIDGFNVYNLIETFILNAWPDVTIIDHVNYTVFQKIGLHYFTLLLNELPLGKHPYDAVKMLADSLRIYVYFNRAGNFVLQSKADIATNGTRRTFNSTLQRSGTTKDFWDKLVDGVTVTVKSGITVNGEVLQGAASVQKYAGIKPRNPREIEIVAPSNIAATESALNTYALSVATDELNFYGKRREARNITSGLLDDMLDWELTDIVEINSKDHFLENTGVDLLSAGFQFDAVTLTGYDYDRQQVHIALSKKNYAAAGTTGSNLSGVSTAIQTTNEQPYKPFSYTNINQAGMLTANMLEGEILEDIILYLSATFDPAHLNLFRAYDVDETFLQLAQIPFGLTKAIKPFRIPIMKLYTADKKVYLELGGSSSATRGAGFLVIKKFKTGVAQ